MTIIKYLAEKLENQQEQKLLFEYLGNLTVVDKELLRVMISHVYDTKGNHQRNVDKETGEVSYATRKTSKLRSGFGQNSKVDVVKAPKNALTAVDSFGETNTQLAMIVQVGEKQVLGIVKHPPASYKDSKTYSITSTAHMWEMISKEDYDKKLKVGKAVGPSVSYSHKDRERGANFLTTKLTGEPMATIRKIVKVVADIAKEKQLELSILYIEPDIAQKQTREERAKAIAGMIPVRKERLPGLKTRRAETAYKEYVKDLKDDLSNRLNKFKINKLKTTISTITTPEELLAKLIEGGYMDKVSFMGEIYDYDDSSVNLNYLKRDQKEYKPSSYNYVRYKLAKGTFSTERTEYNEQRAKMYTELAANLKADPTKTEELQTKYEDAILDLRKQYAPSSFKVLLELIGGVIKPTNVETTHDYYF